MIAQMDNPPPREKRALGFKPLYGQVRDILVARLIEGVWKPGDPLPSEFQLAEELGVSQGTMRKALDELVGRNLLVRRQGRGTFVARHDQQRALFHFFKLEPNDRSRRLPTSQVLGVATGTADNAEREALSLDAGVKVIRVERLRFFEGQAIVRERISLPRAIFAGIEEREALPNTLYALYALDYGVTVAEAREELRAVAAGPEDARDLGLAPGTPLLEIRRVAVALDGRPVELRVSRCDTGHCRYVADLR